jgi:hypothetical protein
MAISYAGSDVFAVNGNLGQDFSTFDLAST